MGYFISAEPSAAEMAAMLTLTGGSSGSAPCDICDGRNLLANPSAEDENIPGTHWTEVSGDWERKQGNGGFPTAKEGIYFFWPGNEAEGER